MFPTDSSQFGDVFGRSRVDLTYCRSFGSERSNYHKQCYSSKPNLSENVQHVQTYKLFFNIWNHPIKDVHTCIIVERCHRITAASVTFTGPERWKQNCSLLSNKYAAGTSVNNKKRKILILIWGKCTGEAILSYVICLQSINKRHFRLWISCLAHGCAKRFIKGRVS